jgi:NTE family protein
MRSNCHGHAPLIGVLLPALLLGAWGCAYQHAKPLQQPPARMFDWEKPGELPNPIGRYYFSALPPGRNNSDRLFVVLAFSGGGTRAAALAYGVLDELRRTTLPCPTDEAGCANKTLLDEVDVISSVSGGSFTAAYYARYGADIFNKNGKFQKNFLRYNAERELFGEAVYYPQNWFRILSRPEIAANLWSKLLFGDSTYNDLSKRTRPFVVLNAADYVTQVRFQFTQDYFDWLCDDLNRFSLSRAVAASSAFPGLLNSMTVNTHNEQGKCPVSRPDPGWLENAREANRFENRLDFRQANTYDKLTAADKKYLHLLDGGLVDNLGLRPVYEGLRDGAGATLPLIRLDNFQRVDNLLVVVVNARTGDKPARVYQPDKLPMGPLTLPVIGATSSLPMGTVSYDSVDMFTELSDALHQARRIQTEKADDDCKRAKERGQECVQFTPTPRMNLYAVELTFENIPNDAPGVHDTRDFFRHLSTDFAQPPSTVDCLSVEGRKLLYESRPYGGAADVAGGMNLAFPEFVTKVLGGSVSPVTERLEIAGGHCAVK